MNPGLAHLELWIDLLVEDLLREMDSEADIEVAPDKKTAGTLSEVAGRNVGTAQ